MNDQFPSALGSARICAEDLGQELSHGQRWLGAIFQAIERAPTVEDAGAIASADLERMRAALNEVSA